MPQSALNLLHANQALGFPSSVHRAALLYFLTPSFIFLFLSSFSYVDFMLEFNCTGILLFIFIIYIYNRELSWRHGVSMSIHSVIK